MAVILSNLLTETDNNVTVDYGTALGNVLVATGTVHLTTEPVVDDLIMYCDLPSNCRLKKLIYYNDDMDAGNNVLVHVGIYAGETFTTSAGVTYFKNAFVNSEAHFVEDYDMLQRENLGEDLRYNIDGDSFLSGGIGYGNAQFPLWQLAFLEEDPKVPLRMGIDIDVAFGNFVAGKTMLQAFYTFKG